MKPSDLKQITIVAGHYGSGKTEFCLNLAIQRLEQGIKTALIDLDIVNPYFRTREKTAELEKMGIKVYGDFYRSDITMEIPALSADVRTPLEDRSTYSIVDLGGNSSGALVAVQFGKYFHEGDYEFLDVINFNRPETRSVKGAADHFHEIEERTGLKFTGLVNNTHLLRETSIDTIKSGVNFCEEVSAILKVPLLYTTCPNFLFDEFIASPYYKSLDHQILPVNLLMRETWLDTKLS
jgi:nucleoside-triphosphatase THEP1